MDEKLIGGLVLAALTGLTIIAYRHPSGYLRIYYALTAILMVILLGVAVWDAAVGKTLGVIAPLFHGDIDRFDAASTAADSLLLGNTFVIEWGAISAYLLFLAFLPGILGKEEPKKEKRQSE